MLLRFKIEIFYIYNLVNDQTANADTTADGNFVVAINKATFDDSDAGTSNSIAIRSSGIVKSGFLLWLGLRESRAGQIDIDSGINSTNVTEIDESLIETQFIIRIRR